MELGSVVFAHKTTEGWEALLSGHFEGGWTITASWPIATEAGTRISARESAALATSVHLVVALEQKTILEIGVRFCANFQNAWATGWSNCKKRAFAVQALFLLALVRH